MYQDNLPFLYKSNPAKKSFTVAIISSLWNEEITKFLLESAEKYLSSNGVNNIEKIHVPGSYELIYGTQKLLQKKEIDGVIAIGCVIKGDTPHFEYICQAVAQGLTNVSIKYEKPVSFGVLTTNTLEQAKERAGGKHGNKGLEAASSLLYVLNQFTDF